MSDDSKWRQQQERKAVKQHKITMLDMSIAKVDPPRLKPIEAIKRRPEPKEEK